MPMIFLKSVLANFFYSFFANGKKAANNLINKMVWLKSSQYRPSSPCSVAAIFDILNGTCLIFAVVENVLEEYCIRQRKFS